MSSIRSIAPRLFFSALVISLIGLMITGTGRSQNDSKANSEHQDAAVPFLGRDMWTQTQQKEKSERPTYEQAEATEFIEKNLRQTVESSQMRETELPGRNAEGLRDQVRKTGKDAGLYTIGEIAEVPGHPSEPPGTVITKESDAVVIGSLTEKHSLLTDHEKDVFTEYQISVSEVLKNDRGIQLPRTIYFVRPGGSISFEGHLIYHTFGEMKPLKTGRQYLLFLKRIPGLDDAFEGASFTMDAGALRACDGVEEFPEGVSFPEARKNILAAVEEGK